MTLAASASQVFRDLGRVRVGNRAVEHHRLGDADAAVARIGPQHVVSPGERAGLGRLRRDGALVDEVEPGGRDGVVRRRFAIDLESPVVEIGVVASGSGEAAAGSALEGRPPGIVADEPLAVQFVLDHVVRVGRDDEHLADGVAGMVVPFQRGTFRLRGGVGAEINHRLAAEVVEHELRPDPSLAPGGDAAGVLDALPVVEFVAVCEMCLVGGTPQETRGIDAVPGPGGDGIRNAAAEDAEFERALDDVDAGIRVGCVEVSDDKRAVAAFREGSAAGQVIDRQRDVLVNQHRRGGGDPEGVHVGVGGDGPASAAPGKRREAVGDRWQGRKADREGAKKRLRCAGEDILHGVCFLEAFMGWENRGRGVRFRRTARILACFTDRNV